MLSGAVCLICSAATWEQAGSPSRQNHALSGPSNSAPVCRSEALTCRPPLWPTAGRYVANEADRPRDIQMWRTGCNRWQYWVAITVSAAGELWNCFADSTAVWRQSLWAFASLTVQLFLSLSLFIPFCVTLFFSRQSYHHTFLYFFIYLLFLFLHSSYYFFTSIFLDSLRFCLVIPSAVKE